MRGFFCFLFEQLFGSGKWRILIVHSYEESYVCYPDFNRLIGKEFRRNLYSLASRCCGDYHFTFHVVCLAFLSLSSWTRAEETRSLWLESEKET